VTGDDAVQPPLFDVPDEQRRPGRRAASPRTTARASYTKFMPKLHRLCDDCVRDIHTRGVAAAPFPAGVRWRRTHEGVTDLLCNRHKDLRVSTDGE
jgi:hypothetical protein